MAVITSALVDASNGMNFAGETGPGPDFGLLIGNPEPIGGFLVPSPTLISSNNGTVASDRLAYNPFGKALRVQELVNLMDGLTVKGINRAAIDSADGQLWDRYSKLYESTSAVSLLKDIEAAADKSKWLTADLAYRFHRLDIGLFALNMATGYAERKALYPKNTIFTRQLNEDTFAAKLIATEIASFGKFDAGTVANFRALSSLREKVLDIDTKSRLWFAAEDAKTSQIEPTPQPQPTPQSIIPAPIYQAATTEAQALQLSTGGMVANGGLKPVTFSGKKAVRENGRVTITDTAEETVLLSNRYTSVLALPRGREDTMQSAAEARIISLNFTWDQQINALFNTGLSGILNDQFKIAVDLFGDGIEGSATEEGLFQKAWGLYNSGNANFKAAAEANGNGKYADAVTFLNEAKKNIDAYNQALNRLERDLTALGIVKRNPSTNAIEDRPLDTDGQNAMVQARNSVAFWENLSGVAGLFDQLGQGAAGSLGAILGSVAGPKGTVAGATVGVAIYDNIAYVMPRVVLNALGRGSEIQGIDGVQGNPSERTVNALFSIVGGWWGVGTGVAAKTAKEAGKTGVSIGWQVAGGAGDIAAGGTNAAINAVIGTDAKGGEISPQQIAEAARNGALVSSLFVVGIPTAGGMIAAVRKRVGIRTGDQVKVVGIEQATVDESEAFMKAHQAELAATYNGQSSNQSASMQVSDRSVVKITQNEGVLRTNTLLDNSVRSSGPAVTADISVNATRGSAVIPTKALPPPNRNVFATGGAVPDNQNFSDLQPGLNQSTEINRAVREINAGNQSVSLANQRVGQLLQTELSGSASTNRLEVTWVVVADQNGRAQVLKIEGAYVRVGNTTSAPIPDMQTIRRAAAEQGISSSAISEVHIGHTHPKGLGEQAGLSGPDIDMMVATHLQGRSMGSDAPTSISSIDYDRGITITSTFDGTGLVFSGSSAMGTVPSHIFLGESLVPVRSIAGLESARVVPFDMSAGKPPKIAKGFEIVNGRLQRDLKTVAEIEGSGLSEELIDIQLSMYRTQKKLANAKLGSIDPNDFLLTQNQLDLLDRWLPKPSDDSSGQSIARAVFVNGGSASGSDVVPTTPYTEIVSIVANDGSTAGPSAIQAGARASVSFKANTKAVGEAIIDRLPVLSDAQKTQLKGWYEKGAKAIKLPEELGFDLGGNVKLQVQNVGLPPYVKSWHTITLSDGTKVHLVELDNGLIGLTAVPPGGKLEPGALWTVGNPDGTYRVELPASSGTPGGVMTVRIPQTLYPSLLSNGDSEVGRALQAIENQAGRIEVGGGRGTGQLNPYIRTGLDTSVNVNESKLFPTQEGIYLGLSPTQLDAMKSAGLIADKPGGGYQLVTHAGPSGTLKIGPAAGSDFSIPFQMVDASRIDSSSGLTDVLKDVMGSAWPDIPNVVQGTFKAGVSYKGTLTSNTALTPRQVELFNGALGSANANGNSTNPIWIGQQINPAQNRTGTDSLLTLLDDRIPDSAVIELLSGDRGADILSAQMRTQFDTIAKKLKEVGIEVSIKANGELRWIWDNPTSRRTSVPNPAELSLLRAIGVDTNLAWPNGIYRPITTRSGIPVDRPSDPSQPGKYVQSLVVFGGGGAQPSYQPFPGAPVSSAQVSSRSLIKFTVDGGTVDIYVPPVVADALGLYPANMKGPLTAPYTSLNSSKSGKVALQDYMAERVEAASSTDKSRALAILAERINSSDSLAGSDPSVLNLQGHTYLQTFLLLDADVVNLSAASVNAQILPRIGSLAATTKDLPWTNPDGSRAFAKPESMSQEDFDQVVDATRNVKNFIDWLKKLGKPVSDGTMPKETSGLLTNPDGTLIASVNGGGSGSTQTNSLDGKLNDAILRERFPSIFPTTAIEPGSVAGIFRDAYNAARSAAYIQEFQRINRERLGSLPNEQLSALAETAISTPEWEAKFSAAGMAAVNATPAAQNAYLNGYIQTMNNGRLARGEEGFTPAQIAVARTTFAAARASGKSESEAAAAAIAAAEAAPAGAAETQPAVREPPPIINLSTLTSWTASAKAVAIATGNPTGVIMANAIETTLGALTTLAQTNAQLKDGVAGNAIATLARGSAKTFAAVVELIGKGDIKSFVAVVNDIAETVAQFATGDERAGFANGLKSIGSLAQVLGTKDRNPASLFTATVFNEISAVVAVGGTRRDRLDAGGEKIPVRNANGTQRTETKNGVPVLVWETEPVPGLIEGRAIQAGGRVLKKFGELSGDKTIQGAAEGLVAYGQFVELSRNGTPGDGAGALVMGLGRGVNLVIGGKTGRLAEDLSAVAQFGLAEEGKTAVLYQIDTTIPVVATTSKIRGADGVEREVTTYTYNTVAVPDPERPTQKKRYIIESGVQAKTVQMAGKAVQVVGKYIDSKLVQALGIAGEHYGQFIRLNANNKPGDGQAVLAVGFGQALNLVIGGETGAAIAELGTITSGVFTGANLTRNVVDSNGQVQYIYEAVIGPNGPDRRPLLGQDGKPLIQQEVVPGREGVYVSAGGKVINLAGRIFDSRELQGVGILVDGAGQYIQMSKDGIANNGTAALVASVGQAFQLLAPGAFGQAIQKLTDIASDVMKIAANTIPGGAGALYAQLAVKALDLIGIKILSTPESQFAFQAVMTLLTANNPIGWALLVLPKLFGMRTFHKENILAAGIDADGDAKFDDSAVLRQQFRQGFFRLNYQNHQIMYDVNGVDVRLLQNANVRMSPQVDKAPLTMRGGYYEEGWASTFFTMPDGTQVIGRVIMGSGGTPLYVMGTGGGNIGGDDPAKAKAAAYFAANPTMNQFGSQYAFVADDGRVFGVASDENADILGVEVPNGSFWLDLSATYGAINPATSGLAVAKRLGLSASDANIWRQAMGGDNVSVSQGDTRLQAGSYLSNALNDISARYQGQRNDPNLYQYMDMNGDGNPDLVRVGLTDKNLKVKGDGLIEVWMLDKDRKQTGVTFKTTSFSKAEEIGMLSGQLLQWGAGRPEFWDSGRDPAALHAMADATGVLAYMKEAEVLGIQATASLLGGVQVDYEAISTRLEQLQTAIASKFDANAYMALHPDVLAWAGGDPNKASLHYLNYGNSERRAIKSSGETLQVWQARADSWDSLAILKYVASYPDLMNAFGADSTAAKAHWNAYGRWEGRTTSFNIDAYLAARPYLREQALVSLATSTPQVLTDEEGRPIRGYDENSGEYFTRYRRDYDGDVAMTTTTPTEEDIKLFATKHWITTGRSENANPYAVSLAAMSPVVQVLGDSIVTSAIGPNQSLVSADGRFSATMQGDGNFVVYDRLARKVTWTAATSAGGYMVMQGDGNVVLYRPGGARFDWASNTSSPGVMRGFTLSMQNDGNLAAYDSQGGEPLWSTVTGRIASPEPNGEGPTMAAYQARKAAKDAADRDEMFASMRAAGNNPTAQASGMTPFQRLFNSLAK